jgi:hypothetical protein
MTSPVRHKARVVFLRYIGAVFVLLGFLLPAVLHREPYRPEWQALLLGAWLHVWGRFVLKGMQKAEATKQPME